MQSSPLSSFYFVHLFTKFWTQYLNKFLGWRSRSRSMLSAECLWHKDWQRFFAVYLGHTHTHTRTPPFYVHFSGKPGLAGSLRFSISILSVLIGWGKTFHTASNTIRPYLLRAYPVYSFLNITSPSLHHLYAQHVNHCNLSLLTDKLTGFSPSNYLSSVLFFLSFKLNQHIHLITLISLLSNFNFMLHLH